MQALEDGASQINRKPASFSTFTDGSSAAKNGPSVLTITEPAAVSMVKYVPPPWW